MDHRSYRPQGGFGFHSGCVEKSWVILNEEVMVSLLKGHSDCYVENIPQGQG